MTKIDYKKIVAELNNDLTAKYSSLEMRNLFPEFEYDEFRNYFTVGKDSYNFSIIYFLNMVIYSEGQNQGQDHSELEVVSQSKLWFNNYIVSLAKLKF